LYELKKAGEKTYYLESPTKIGIYKVDDKNVYLIDSGNDKDAGRMIARVLSENNWNLLGIINTHSNADHIGGNKYLQNKTGCSIISTDIENTFAKYPILESSFLYGGYPCSKIRNKFLMATSCEPTNSVDKFLPDGLEYIELPGHYFGMIGIKTSDNIYFLADCVFSENIINKYHVFFIYDVKAFLCTLDKIDQLDGILYIPSHAEVTNNVASLTKLNRDKIFEIIDIIIQICKDKICFEEILKKVFDSYNLNMDFNQYVLVGSTIRSYLSYLHEENRLECIFEENRLLWKTI